MMIDCELIKNVVSMFVLNSIWETLGFILYFLMDRKQSLRINQFINLLLIN